MARVLSSPTTERTTCRTKLAEFGSIRLLLPHHQCIGDACSHDAVPRIACHSVVRNAELCGLMMIAAAAATLDSAHAQYYTSRC